MHMDLPRRSVSDIADADGASYADSSRKTHYGPRGRQFVTKHGSKVHAYEPAKAPWPLSYDKASLEQ